MEFPGAYYHVMWRGVAGMPTFLEDQDRRAFLDVLGGLVDRGDLEVHAFCLMRNHYHLLLRTPRGELGRRLRLWALSVHSRLRRSEVARRYARTRAAVTIAVREIEGAARRDRALSARLRREAVLGPKQPLVKVNS